MQMRSAEGPVRRQRAGGDASETASSPKQQSAVDRLDNESFDIDDELLEGSSDSVPAVGSGQAPRPASAAGPRPSSRTGTPGGKAAAAAAAGAGSSTYSPSKGLISAARQTSGSFHGPSSGRATPATLDSVTTSGSGGDGSEGMDAHGDGVSLMHSMDEEGALGQSAGTSISLYAPGLPVVTPGRPAAAGAGSSSSSSSFALGLAPPGHASRGTSTASSANPRSSPASSLLAAGAAGGATVEIIVKDPPSSPTAAALHASSPASARQPSGIKLRVTNRTVGPELVVEHEDKYGVPPMQQQADRPGSSASTASTAASRKRGISKTTPGRGQGEKKAHTGGGAAAAAARAAAAAAAGAPDTPTSPTPSSTTSAAATTGSSTMPARVGSRAFGSYSAQPKSKAAADSAGPATTGRAAAPLSRPTSSGAVSGVSGTTISLASTSGRPASHSFAAALDAASYRGRGTSDVSGVSEAQSAPAASSSSSHYRSAAASAVPLPARFPEAAAAQAAASASALPVHDAYSLEHAMTDDLPQAASEAMARSPAHARNNFKGIFSALSAGRPPSTAPRPPSTTPTSSGLAIGSMSSSGAAPNGARSGASGGPRAPPPVSRINAAFSDMDEASRHSMGVAASSGRTSATGGNADAQHPGATSMRIEDTSDGFTDQFSSAAGGGAVNVYPRPGRALRSACVTPATGLQQQQQQQQPGGAGSGVGRAATPGTYAREEAMVGQLADTLAHHNNITTPRPTAGQAPAAVASSAGTSAGGGRISGGGVAGSAFSAAVPQRTATHGPATSTAPSSSSSTMLPMSHIPMHAPIIPPAAYTSSNINAMSLDMSLGGGSTGSGGGNSLANISMGGWGNGLGEHGMLSVAGIPVRSAILPGLGHDDHDHHGLGGVGGLDPLGIGHVNTGVGGMHQSASGLDLGSMVDLPMSGGLSHNDDWLLGFGNDGLMPAPSSSMPMASTGLAAGGAAGRPGGPLDMSYTAFGSM